MGFNPKLICKHGIICLMFCFYLLPKRAYTGYAGNQAHLPETDTTQIKELFKLGNRFFDGPSDSLIHYYNAALSLINKSLRAIPETDKTFLNKHFRTLRALEKEANIQLGIENLLQGNYDQSLQYYQQALLIAEELDDISAISECYGEIGTLYNNQGNYDLALEYQQKALAIARQINDEDWIAICNNQTGNVYKKKSFYILSLRHYIEALEYFERTGQLRRVAVIYQNIGDIYYAQKDYEKALDYYNRTRQLANETGNRQREADSYLLSGLAMSSQGNQSPARKYIQQAIDLYNELGYRHGLDDCYIALGNTWLQESNWLEAESNYQKALSFADSADDKASIAEALIKLGLVFLKQTRYQKSGIWLSDGLELAEETRSKELILEANNILSQLYEALGESQQALQYFRNYAVLKDSLFSASQYRTISEMEAIYEASKKEQDIALLSERNLIQTMIITRRNRLLILTIVFFAVVLLAAYLYFANTRLKAERKAVELENRLLRSQMNPHFIFNSLIAIQSYFYEQNPVKAGDFLAKFAELMRITLENSRTEFVLFEKELAMIRIYLELQALRFDNIFSFNITVDENIDAANIRIPPMLAQPFIENAVEHGLRNKSEQGKLSIGFSKNENSLMVRVEDNGIGREAAKKICTSAEHLSLAVPMIKERLDIMTKKFRYKFEMKINDLYGPDGSPAGTRVEITMPWQG
jgi:tetratricopeptide (TPR) repeat protein